MTCPKMPFPLHIAAMGTGTDFHHRLKRASLSMQATL